MSYPKPWSLIRLYLSIMELGAVSSVAGILGAEFDFVAWITQ